MRFAAILCCVLSAPSLLRAEEPILVQVPTENGCRVVPLSPPLTLPQLAERGRNEKRTGAALIGTATALLVVSGVLGGLTARSYGYSDCRDQNRSSTCWITDGVATELSGSVILGLAGIAMLPAGIALFLRGGDHIDAASRLGHASIAPYLARDGGGATLKLSF